MKEGYYKVESIVMTLAILALCRIRNPEQTKQCKPGELGRVIGLDRIPEVKCLREKIKALSSQNKSKELGQGLFKHWMASSGAEDIFLYVDGHIRIYYGDKATLPVKFVSRQKLCLAATTEFWVNDACGSPLMVVNGELSEKLQHIIQQEIVPEIIQSGVLPETAADSTTPRCTIVFDREAYSVPFFKALHTDRIAILTYRKNVKDLWDPSLFKGIEIKHLNAKITMRVCERNVALDGLAMREIRVLTDTGHQTAILTTHPDIPVHEVAIKMFSRWNQENYFKYMMENYDFDKMVTYGVEAIDENKEVVNPPHRRLTQSIKKTKEKMSRLEAKFYPLVDQVIDAPLEKIPVFTVNQKLLRDQIDALARDLEKLKGQLKDIPPRIKLKDMPDQTRYNKLKTESKLLMNSIKMICYRAETALANLAIPHLARHDDEKRKFVRQIIDSPVDMKPDYTHQTLTLTILSLSAPRYNQALTEIIHLLNQTETVFPGTDLKLIFAIHAT